MKAKAEKYYDDKNSHLVYLKANASSEFWDEHWNEQDKVRLLRNPPKHRFICGVTRKHLAVGARILEGGCGLGDKVYALKKAGYEPVGVDFAKETVAWVNQNLPDLHVVEGDVMNLEFDEGYFDGYWSLGVIEHFYNGYDSILQEAFRVLRSGGILFLTFPAMSGFRKRKAANGRYDPWQESSEQLARFYQFALDPDRVTRQFENGGFKLIESRGIGSLKGLEDEIGEHRLLNLLRKLPFGGAAKVSVISDFLVGNLFAHSRLLVLQKT